MSRGFPIRLIQLTRVHVYFRQLVDKGEELTEQNSFNMNRGTMEMEVARTKVNEFVQDFLSRLVALEGEISSLSVFCRVDMSIFVGPDRRVSYFVNEVERGITTCLWVSDGPGVAGHIGADLAWPLAVWINAKKVRLQQSNRLSNK